MDLVGGNFESNTLTFTRETYEKKGITVLDFQEVTIAGFKAKFSHIKGADGTESIQLVFGDETFSAAVFAIYHYSLHNELFSEIKKSFLSIKYDKSLIVDPFAAGDFIVEKNNSKFKFAKASANMFIFSENGNVKDAYENEPMVMITSMPFDKTMTKEEALDTLLKGLLNQGFIKKETKNLSKKSINGYDAIEVEFYFEHKSENKLVLMTVLIGKNKSIVFYGMTDSNFEENIPEFKKLSHAIKIK